MIAVYFLIGFIVIIGIIYLYHKVTKKAKKRNYICHGFLTTLVTLLNPREMAGEVVGKVDIDFYLLKAHELFIHFGGVGLDYYYGLTIAFLATFISFGGYLYSRAA